MEVYSLCVSFLVAGRWSLVVAVSLLFVACSSQRAPQSSAKPDPEAARILDKYSVVQISSQTSNSENDTWYRRRFRDGKDVAYRIIRGRMVFSDDVVFGTEREFASFIDEYYSRKAQPQRVSGQAIETEICTGYFFAWCVSWSQLTWPNAIIRYQIWDSNGGYSFGSRRDQILAAIKQWTDSSPIRFEYATSGSRVIFRPDPLNGNLSACYAETGYRNREQYVWLLPACGQAEIAHEIGHATGLEHEHQRCDRDSYVAVQTANIQSGNLYAFDKICGDGGNDIYYYDYYSIMHYRATAFSSNGQATLVSTTSTPIPNYYSNPTQVSGRDVQNGIAYRYRASMPCTIWSNGCGYGGGVGSSTTNYGFGGNPNKIRVWICGDGGDYRVTLKNPSTSQILGVVTSSGGGATWGYIDSISLTNSSISRSLNP